MSTIVTYNRGAQGLPVAGGSTDSRIRVWEDFDGPTTKFTLSNYAVGAGAGGVLKNGDHSGVNSATGAAISGDMREEGSASFLVRVKFAGTAAGNAENEFACGFAVAAARAQSITLGLAIEVVAKAEPKDATFAARVDTGTNAGVGDADGKISLVKGLENFDPAEYFTLGGVMRHEGDFYVAKFFVNGIEVAEKRVTTNGSLLIGGACGLFALQPAVADNVGDADVDYIAGDFPR